jgi:hypothetical protein
VPAEIDHSWDCEILPFAAHHKCSVMVSSDRFGWPLGAGIDETGLPRPPGAGTRCGNTDAIALNSGSDLLGYLLPMITVP